VKNNLVIARPSARAFARRPARQRGVALFIVLVLVMLSMLLAVWASRSSLFSEMVVGNDADYQRAFEAAQALEQDAKLDILGQRADGRDCSSTACRETTANAKIPQQPPDVISLIIHLADTNTDTQCDAALCVRRAGRQDFWNNNGSFATDPTVGEASLPDMQAVGARYGQYTGAGIGSTASPINPILTDRTDGQGGWYWIEVLPYDPSSQTKGLCTDCDGSSAESLGLVLMPNVVYRITSIAYGRKAGTRVVLQSTFVKRRKQD